MMLSRSTVVLDSEPVQKLFGSSLKETSSFFICVKYLHTHTMVEDLKCVQTETPVASSLPCRLPSSLQAVQEQQECVHGGLAMPSPVHRCGADQSQAPGGGGCRQQLQ